MDLQKKLEKIVESNIDNEAHFLVDVSIFGNKGKKKVKILLDGDEGVSVDDCSRLSRKVSDIIEEEGVIEAAYILEVSSPGVDYHLKFKRQYTKNIGRRLKVVLSDGGEQKGELLEVKEDTILVKAEKKNKKKIDYSEVEIAFDDINKTNVLVSFK